MMDDSLRLRIEYEIESLVSLFWSLGIHDTETVHHAMDMCIDSDIGHVVEN
jgi:cellobiose-specific phosphotransferase system component IIC